MTFFLWLLFAVSVAVPVSFFLYPVLLGLAGRRGPDGEPGAPPAPPPHGTLVVAVRNGADLLPAKVANCLSLDYPADRLDLLFLSDGSDDDTASLLQAYEQELGPRFKGLVFQEHRGKNGCLRAALPHLKGELVFLSDVDAIVAPDALRLLARHMDDAAVGGVCGRRDISQKGGAMGKAQRLYARFDSFIKAAESARGSISSNDGKLYCLRRELMPAIPDGVTDDLYAALSVVEAGYRFVYDPAATAAIPIPSQGEGHEVIRRRRIVTGSLRGIFAKRALLDPKTHGLFAVSLFVNKVLRRMLPLSLIGLLASSLLLALTSGFMALLLAGQLGGYALALCSPLMDERWPGPVRKVASAARYFVLGNWGVLLALWDLALGRRVDKWDPVKTRTGRAKAGRAKAAGQGVVGQDANGQDANGQDALGHNAEKDSPHAPPQKGAPAVAYVMSRFPKITETFVLYEMQEVEREGLRVEVYPLLRHRDAAEHPEAARYVKRAHYTPFVSLDILRSNATLLARSPGRYVRTLARVVAAAAPSPKFLLHSLAIWPKSVHIARHMRDTGVGHVHAHFATHPATTAYIVNQLADTPYSFTAHAHDIFMDTHMLEMKTRAASFVVVISEFNRRWITERYGTDLDNRLHTIHCGVDPTVFTPRPQTRAPGPTRLISVASFKDMKGHVHLLDACAMLRDQGVQFECRLVGDGPLRSEVEEQIARLGLQDHVLVMGALARGQVSELTRQSDVAVLASVRGARGDMEGIPVALMEAMCVGLPVVSTRLSGIPELVQDGVSGFIVEPGQPRPLADSLKRLILNEPLARRMGQAGRKRVLQEFDLRSNAASLVSLFRRSLSA